MHMFSVEQQLYTFAHSNQDIINEFQNNAANEEKIATSLEITVEAVAQLEFTEMCKKKPCQGCNVKVMKTEERNGSICTKRQETAFKFIVIVMNVVT